jgi:hypothetical protein
MKLQQQGISYSVISAKAGIRKQRTRVCIPRLGLEGRHVRNDTNKLIMQQAVGNSQGKSYQKL